MSPVRIGCTDTVRTRADMMGAKLSEDTVKNLPIPDSGNRVTYFPGQTIQGATAPRGFGVRVTAGGTRAFVLNYRVAGVERRYTIGASPDWSVLRAVRRARELRQAVDKGEDPVAARVVARTPEPAGKTVADVLDDFAVRHLRKNLRSGARVEKALNDLVKPVIGATGIYTLRRIAIAEMLDGIEEVRGPVAADRTLAYVRKALNWYATRDGEFNSPIVRGMARTNPKERERERVLADDEIRDLWAALDQMTGYSPFRRLVRALLLSGQRRDEVARMRWDEIEGDVWTIPAVRYKTKRDHVVPLTLGMLAEIGAMPVRKASAGATPKDAGPFVFSTTDGDKPFSGYGKAKIALDAAISVVREKEGRGAMAPWVLHDLRRTASTLMNRAAVSSTVAERVLGHVILGVQRTYNRYEYLAEKRDALERLGALVERILRPQVDNVTALNDRRRSA
jgi:integrase